MDLVDTILLAILCFLFYKFIFEKELFEQVKDDEFIQDDNQIDELFDQMTKNSDNSHGTLIEKIPQLDKSINSINSINLDNPSDQGEFIEQQFHTDYRDTITAFNNLSPQKQIFNRSDMPIKTIVPKISEVKELVKSFVKQVNYNCKYNVTEFIEKNSGWDELLPEQEVKSGWEKQQEKLGLPVSIYNKPAKKSKVKLIKVEHIEKYATTDQIKYVIIMILQKPHVKDQIVIRLSMVLNNSNSLISTISVNIEEIFVMGFIINGKLKSNLPHANFYNFEQIEKDGILDQKEILKQLDQKYKDMRNHSYGFSTDIEKPLVGISPMKINELAMKHIKQNDSNNSNRQFD